MALELFAHPFSSYCQKVLVALYETGTPFEFRMVAHDDPAAQAQLAALWPLKRFPVLVDDGATIVESTSIIEHLDLHHAAAVRMLPADPATALPVRTLDRFFDNYVSTPMQTIVFDRIRPEGSRDPYGVDQARALLDRAYGWLDDAMAGAGTGAGESREWAAGRDFGLADCAAAPALFYADWVHPVAETFAHVRAYRARLLARPSFARAVDAARPFRVLFPGGAPERD